MKARDRGFDFRRTILHATAGEGRIAIKYRFSR
jgi:hypothetical protein